MGLEGIFATLAIDPWKGCAGTLDFWIVRSSFFVSFVTIHCFRERVFCWGGSFLGSRGLHLGAVLDGRGLPFCPSASGGIPRRVASAVDPGDSVGHLRTGQDIRLSWTVKWRR